MVAGSQQMRCGLRRAEVNITPEPTDGNAWVIVCDAAPGARGVRYFLVAATGPAQALSLVHDEFGKDLELSVRGPAPAAHLERRGMQLGDVFEIVGNRGVGA